MMTVELVVSVLLVLNCLSRAIEATRSWLNMAVLSSLPARISITLITKTIESASGISSSVHRQECMERRKVGTLSTSELFQVYRGF